MKSPKGYMLLEVVLALSIFVVAVVGLMRCLSAGLDANYQQKRQTVMRLNLQSLLDETLASRPVAGVTKFPADAYNTSYQREITPEEIRMPNGKALNDIFKISVTAIDSKKDNKVIAELWTYASL